MESRGGRGQQQKQGEQKQQQGGQQHEQRRRKVSAMTLTKRKATWTSPGQNHGDPAGPDKSQDGACGRSHSRASALAAGWLK